MPSVLILKTVPAPPPPAGSVPWADVVPYRYPSVPWTSPLDDELEERRPGLRLELERPVEQRTQRLPQGFVQIAHAPPIRGSQSTWKTRRAYCSDAPVSGASWDVAAAVCRLPPGESDFPTRRGGGMSAMRRHGIGRRVDQNAILATFTHEQSEPGKSHTISPDRCPIRVKRSWRPGSASRTERAVVGAPPERRRLGA